MTGRLLCLLLVLGSLAMVTSAGDRAIAPTLALGSMLIGAYGIGFVLERFGLPRITGYMLAGVALGPYGANFFDESTISNLQFLNSLALAFIAFCAGGELRLDRIKKKFKSIVSMLTGSILVVWLGVTLAVFLLSPFIPLLQPYPTMTRLAIAALFGVISTARSPSSAIAIISETRAKGPYTDTVLAVTVAVDVVVIMLFAVVAAVAQIMLDPNSTFSLATIGVLGLEITVACVGGHLLGRCIIFLADRVHVEFAVIIAAMGFFVVKFSHGVSELLETYDIEFNVESLLICMAAGFTVQNASRHGERFLRDMDRVSLPIYVAFFAITGASINLGALQAGWMLGLVVVVCRAATLYVGSWAGGRLVGDDPAIYKNAWLGFITQACVSLALVAELTRRFPQVGVHVESILITAITLNQIIGPITFKYVLRKVGESRILDKRGPAS